MITFNFQSKLSIRTHLKQNKVNTFKLRWKKHFWAVKWTTAVWWHMWVWANWRFTSIVISWWDKWGTEKWSVQPRVELSKGELPALRWRPKNQYGALYFLHLSAAVICFSSPSFISWKSPHLRRLLAFFFSGAIILSAVLSPFFLLRSRSGHTFKGWGTFGSLRIPYGLVQWITVQLEQLV